MNNYYGKNVVITGASSGIGMNIAQTLRDMGFNVFGISRRGGLDSNSKCGGSLTMLKADVTDELRIHELSSLIESKGGADILINAAGVGICGSVEETKLVDARFQLEANYFGILNMLNAFVPQMRKNRRGLIINIGSVGGIYPIPFQTHYSSSKAAVEVMTAGLRLELAPFGVKAVLVEPGDISTGFTSTRRVSVTYSDSHYGCAYKNSVKQMERDEQNGGSPDAVTKVIVSLIGRKHPPLRKIVGIKYKIFVFLKRILPNAAVLAILKSMYPNSTQDEH